MSFSNLTPTDRDAFFALLDEYFTSRPHLLGGLNGAAAAKGANGPPGRPAVGPSPPQNTSSNNGTASSGSPPLVPTWKRPSQDVSSTPKPDSDVATPRLSVFAAAAAFNAAGGGPRPPPRRFGSSSSSINEQQQVTPDSAPESEVNKLVAGKKFGGDVDVSSAKNAFTSLRNATANKTATPAPAAPPTPSAFGAKKNSFAPPPVRRVSTTYGTGAARSAAVAPPPPARQEVQEQEEESQGEWAEVLYDYSSEDPGDLEIQTGQHVLVLERTSDDWWTGELDGRKGLVPASYVKLV